MNFPARRLCARYLHCSRNQRVDTYDKVELDGWILKLVQLHNVPCALNT
jgi:IS5 family transposase